MNLPSFREIEIASPVAEYGLVIIAIESGSAHPWGSAVFISPQLALTAKHVVLDFWQKLDGRPLPTTGTLRPTYRTFAVQFLGGAPALWEVSRCWAVPWSDLALLELRPADAAATSYEWKGHIRLSAEPPAIGERVAGFGYAGTVATANQATPQSFDLSLPPFTTYATVTQVFEERRDSGLLDFPCIEIDGRIAGGMSGGPVFNERGSLCGINCSSLQGVDADLSYTSGNAPAGVATLGGGVSHLTRPSSFA